MIQLYEPNLNSGQGSGEERARHSTSVGLRSVCIANAALLHQMELCMMHGSYMPEKHVMQKTVLD